MVYSRERMIEMIRLSVMQNDAGVLCPACTVFQYMNADEFRIVSGALQYTEKVVKDVMTPVANVFMLHCDAVLNAQKITEIIQTGYTRIPVYESEYRTPVVLAHVALLSESQLRRNTAQCEGFGAARPRRQLYCEHIVLVL